MKIIVRDFLFGFLVVIVITISEFLVTLPFGDLWEYSKTWEFSPEVYQHFINRELLLTSLPTPIIIFIFMVLLKTKRKSDAIRRGIIWTSVLSVNYIIIGIGNDNFKVIFSTVGIYVLLACSLLGMIFYVKLKNLE